MKKISYLPVLIVFILLICTNTSVVAITVPWSTTFDCEDWTQSDGLYNVNCDDMTGWGNWTASGGEEEQITASANNPGGGGGKGQIHWVGDGTNNNSGGLTIQFDNIQTEIWFRWYIQYEKDFQWEYVSYAKIIFFNPGQTHAVYWGWYSDNKVQSRVYKDARQVLQVDGVGWDTVMQNGGGSTYQTTNSSGDLETHYSSDGQWHCWEVHAKMDTNGSNGIAGIWMDGVKVLSYTDVDYDTTAGWDTILIGSNQAAPGNGKAMAVNYDDIAISNTGYIGLLSNSANITPPAAPTGGQVQ